MSNDIKVGDEVVAVENNWAKDLSISEKYCVTKVKIGISGEIFLRVDGIPRSLLATRFKKVPKPKQPEYSFDIQNTIEIVNEELATCVTKAEPLAYYDVRCESGETKRFIIIHHTLMRKADQCALAATPPGCTEYLCIPEVGDIYFCYDFNVAVKWAKDVRYAARISKNPQTIKIFKVNI